ncbi:unnamed protein product [Pedinophyceae sp. YPF-701]|nr:unnamed protein product [Pedinophyceae sp. YPF-701]
MQAVGASRTAAVSAPRTCQRNGNAPSVAPCRCPSCLRAASHVCHAAATTGTAVTRPQGEEGVKRAAAPVRGACGKCGCSPLATSLHCGNCTCHGSASHVCRAAATEVAAAHEAQVPAGADEAVTAAHACRKCGCSSLAASLHCGACECHA